MVREQTGQQSRGDRVSPRRAYMSAHPSLWMCPSRRVPGATTLTQGSCLNGHGCRWTGARVKARGTRWAMVRAGSGVHHGESGRSISASEHIASSTGMRLHRYRIQTATGVGGTAVRDIMRAWCHTWWHHGATMMPPWCHQVGYKSSQVAPSRTKVAPSRTRSHPA